jgi:hypothetical protein
LRELDLSWNTFREFPFSVLDLVHTRTSGRVGECVGADSVLILQAGLSTLRIEGNYIMDVELDRAISLWPHQRIDYIPQLLKSRGAGVGLLAWCQNKVEAFGHDWDKVKCDEATLLRPHLSQRGLIVWSVCKVHTGHCFDERLHDAYEHSFSLFPTRDWV